MSRGRPKKPLKLSNEVKKQLLLIANSRSLPHSQVRRAKIILMSDQGLTNSEKPLKVNPKGLLTGHAEALPKKPIYPSQLFSAYGALLTCSPIDKNTLPCQPILYLLTK